MKNNIIKDDREISMKSESFDKDVSDDESTATDYNLPIEVLQMNTQTLADRTDPSAPAHPIEIVEPTQPMTMAEEPIADSAAVPMETADEPIVAPAAVSVTMADEPVVEPAAALESSQTELVALFENAKSTATDFFNQNQQIFIAVGWILLAIFGIKVLFATLGIIDDIPLVTPLIKVVGLVSVVRFSWRYLVRKHDRQELIEIIDRKKVEILGDRKSLS